MKEELPKKYYEKLELNEFKLNSLLEITKAIKIEIRIVLKSIFLLKLFIDIKIKAIHVIKIPIIPKKGIISFIKIKDKIVTKIGAHPLAIG